MPTDVTHDRPHDPGEPGLAPQDRLALDRLIQRRAGAADAADAPDRPEDEREAQLERLLGLLDTPVAGADRTLVDLTYLRVLRASSTAEDRLSDASADALDAWAQCGFDAGAVPPSLRDQATQHERLAALCTQPIPGEREGRRERIERVLERIQHEADAQADRFRIDRRRTGLSSLRLSDLVSIAAMFLLATAVVLPVLNAVRQKQRVELCRANFGGVGGAMDLYASSYGSMLPMASAGLGGSWIDVGTTPERSNSANLYLLVRTNHVPLERLACPGNPEAPTARLSPNQQDWRRLEEISYSYQVTPKNAPPSWRSGERRIVIADRSPVILRLVRGDTIYPNANSTNHDGEGQHALYTDGSVTWLRSPVVEGDNIWLPRIAEDQIHDARVKLGLKGDERPASSRDVFLAP